jgi:plasmid stabilization system protein ParE
MSRRLIFLPDVRTDFLEGFNYYENLSPERGGTRFEQAFRETLRQAETGLITHTKVFQNFHRAFLFRFPYTVYYRLSGERAVIVAVLYSRFDPKRVEAILKQRFGH